MHAVEQIASGFAFHLDYFDESGHRLGGMRLRPADFDHAVRHTLFDAYRQGRCEIYQPVESGALITPLFPERADRSSHATGFRVAATFADGSKHACYFDINYFQSIANLSRAELLRSGAIANEQKLIYRLHALLENEPSESPVKKLSLTLEPATNRIAIERGSRRELETIDTWDHPLAAELPVLIEQSVLVDVVAEANANPNCEVGGFLLGRIVRDNQNGEIFTAITGVASADDTSESSNVSVTFTPASFLHARKLAVLRGASESICGWYHSHPFKLCAECPLPTPGECISKILFYSQDDVHLMETTFEQPYMVGLLAAIDLRIEQTIGHLPVRLYGWRQGVIQQRGFEVVRARTS